jgi:hypothetical protein
VTLPVFLGIGALKAGTTTVHVLLSRHPQVALPQHRKEVMFFDRYWDRGVAWYEQQFAHAGDRLPGEITPNYLYDPAVPARVAATLPGVRLFAVLRDPVARAVSQYRHHVREQGWQGGFEDFLREHPNAVARGRYAEQLRRWLDHVDATQLLLLRSEDLAADAGGATAPLITHLGLSPLPAPPPTDERHNAAATPRSPTLSRLARRTARWLHDHDLGWVVERARRGGLPGVLARPGEAGPPIPADALARLQAAYTDDQEDLERLRLWRSAAPGPT